MRPTISKFRIPVKKNLQVLYCPKLPFRLIDALDDYWAMTDQTPIDVDHFRRDFPGSLTVDQALATWKHIADYKVKRH